MLQSLFIFCQPRRSEKLLRFFLMLSLCLAMPIAAQASTGHYPNGSLGVRAGSLPPPGAYWGMTSMYYKANDVRNKNGNKINVDYSLDILMFAPHFLYTSQEKILGARYGFDLLIPIVYTDFYVGKSFNIRLPNHQGITDISASRSATQTGLGDIMLTPAMLTWETDRYDITAGLSVFLPTGEYDSHDPSSPGKGFFTISPSLGATLYLDEEKTWTAAGMLRYEVHMEQDQTHRTQGNHAHFEWGVGKTLAQIFSVGIAGYNAWQVTADYGPGSRDNKSTANAVGPELGVFIPGPNMSVTLRHLWEYENRNNAQGHVTTLTVILPF